MTTLLLIGIYLSFSWDFLLLPIASEASTGALARAADNRFSRTQLLMYIGHIGILCLWLYPLLQALWQLMSADSNRSGTFWPVFWPGLAIATGGRLITLRASYLLRTAATGTLLQLSLFSVSRHPIVVGLHLTLAGLLLSTGSVTPWLAFPLVLIYFDWKIKLEEKALIEKYAEQYHDYAARTPRYLQLPMRWRSA